MEGFTFLPKITPKWFAVHPFIVPVVAQMFRFAQVITIVMSAAWLRNSKAVDWKTRSDFMNVKYTQTLHLGINGAVLTSPLLADGSFFCVLTYAFS